MWALRNRTPYAAERSWTRDKRGAHHWLVAVKATFDVGDGGEVKLANEQKPPLLALEYAGKPGESSVRYEADLGPMKPTTDITLVGSAHAPGGRPAPRVPVALRIDTIQKSLWVYGERVYYRSAVGIEPSPAAPFTSRPIVYELAFGGSDTTASDPSRHAMDKRNPVGRGFAAALATFGLVAVAGLGGSAGVRARACMWMMRDDPSHFFSWSPS